MTDPMTLIILIVIAALVFDFINGFHDAANATATIVATRVLKHWQAVLWAATFNFLALFFVSSGVAKTVGAGLVDLSYVTPPVIIAALVAGIAWNLFTWWRAIPASSSHTLLGAYAGAIFGHVWLQTDAAVAGAYIMEGWVKVIAFIFIAPLLGYALGHLLMRLTARLTPVQDGGRQVRFFGALQLASSAMLSFNHGANDAQKTAGIIATGLVATGYMRQADFHIPEWVLLAAYVVIALGTLSGGWRITKTLGFKLAQLKPAQGFSAESGAAISIALATWLHMPISTTLAITGGVVGASTARQRPAGERAVYWPLLYRIMMIWALTMPVAFGLGLGAIALLGLVN